MKIIFSSLKNSGIFEDDFMHLSEQNGSIEFKRMQTPGGIAVVYAPNGTGKTSFANLLSMEVSEGKCSFNATDEHGNIITPETKSFHVIQDQINRNVIHGETTDYLIGAQIRREYELREKINLLFKKAYEDLASKYKKDFSVSKVKDYLLFQMQSLTDQIHQTAYHYIRSIVNSRQHGKDIDRTSFVTFIRNNENRPTIPELNDEKRSFVITDLSKAKIIEKILSINPDEIITDTNVILVEQHDDAIEILNKYHSLNNCIVCDNPSFNGDVLLEKKKEKRKYIYDNLDKKTKDILDKIVRDSSLISSDPFDVKKIVGAFITGEDSTRLVELQRELTLYVNSIGDEMIVELFHCFDGTSLFNNFDEYTQLVETQPQLDSEELLFIENIINENISQSAGTVGVCISTGLLSPSFVSA